MVVKKWRDLVWRGNVSGTAPERSHSGCRVACTGWLFFLHGVGILPSPRFGSPLTRLRQGYGGQALLLTALAAFQERMRAGRANQGDFQSFVGAMTRKYGMAPDFDEPLECFKEYM